MAKKINEPSKTALLEMKLREEKEFSPSWRTSHLLTAMSHLKKHTYMTEDKMADQLKFTRSQIQDSLKYLVALEEPRIFDKKAPKGVHRPNHYHRHLLPHETPAEFVYKVQSHPKMDLCYGMHWVAIDRAKDTGVAEFSAHKIWPNRSEEAFRQARRKMDRLGYFTVVSDPITGKPAKYILNREKFALAEAEHDTRKQTEHVKPVEPKPTTTWAAKQEEAKAAKQEEVRRRKEAEAEEIARREAESRQKLAEAVGVTLEGEERRAIYVRPGAGTTKSGKRIISFDLTVGKAKAEIDENDL